MKQLFACIMVLIALKPLAQNTGNAVIFSENREKFIVFMNAVQQNKLPEANVKITGIDNDFVRIKIEFENKTIKTIDRNFALKMGSEVTYILKKTAPNIVNLRYYTESPIRLNAKPVPGQRVIVFNDPDVLGNGIKTGFSPPPANGNIGQPVIVNGNGTTNQTNVNTTTTSQNNPNANGNMGINMGVNVNPNGGGISVGAPGVNFNMNVNVDPNVINQNTTTTTTTTQTTTTTNGNTNVIVTQPQQFAATQQQVNGNACVAPVLPSDFNAMKNSISSKSFEDVKLKIAKQLLGSNCFSVNQIKEIMQLFSFEESKLQFAKDAYARCVDRRNYFKINDAFTFESSIEELQQYIEGYSD